VTLASSHRERVDDPVTSAPCRACGGRSLEMVLDLGLSPLCEDFRTAEQLDEPETFYPLRVTRCPDCGLVQLSAYVPPDRIFSEYAYFSSYSDSWVDHAARYVEGIVARRGLDDGSLVVELGSNDGYLLQHFVRRGVPALGIDPAANVAAAAIGRGIPTRVAFFGREVAHDLARQQPADLIIGNNVLAQVPDLDDFVGGMATLLAPSGLITLEVPHLLRLIEGNQFDTIYHEHFSYFSLASIERLMGRHGFAVVDVEELPTHGGSIRVHVVHKGAAAGPSDAVGRVLAAESAFGLQRTETYQAFGRRIERVRSDVLAFLIEQRRAGRRVAGYGAPGKANTFLNYCGIRPDLLGYTVDRNPYKHGRFTPGAHIPIHAPDRLLADRPDIVWILPWNLRDEIVAQLSSVRDWGGRFMVAIPGLAVDG
jgi:SAM-dependent methyltransferase